MKKPTKKRKAKAPHADESPLCERVWMVYNPARSTPTCAHGSERSATDEARRLAGLHPGERFIVLEAVAAYLAMQPEPVRLRMIDPPEKEADDDDLPF